jgi:CRISPR/Cas system CMR subunit Cmr4 (Cas7 group RAMP superfamily)
MNDVLITHHLGLAVEPIHIGGQRVGNEWTNEGNTVRDIDGFPYVPASSLKGSVRASCSMNFGAEGCDGKGWNCSQPHKCPSCAVFGFANYHHGRTSSSLVRFSSANLLSVPLLTDQGMMWVTSWHRLRESGVFLGRSSPTHTNLSFAEDLTPKHASDLSHLLTPSGGEVATNARSLTTTAWAGPDELRETYRRTLIVDEFTFSSLRRVFTGSATSVSVDARTGQAREGALFNVEFINRMSVLYFNVIFVNPVIRGIREFVNAKTPKSPEIRTTLPDIAGLIRYGLDRLQYFGIGGKRSRGYGRMLVWEISRESPEGADTTALADSAPGPMVFISHSSKDKAVARRLAADLQAEHFDVWLDEKRILVGDSIHQQVEEGIQHCDYLVLLLSSDALESPWVADEVNAIRMREKDASEVVLLPAVVGDVTSDHLPALLKDRKYTTLSAKMYGTGLQELVDSIRGHQARRGRGGA